MIFIGYIIYIIFALVIGYLSVKMGFIKIDEDDEKVAVMGGVALIAPVVIGLLILEVVKISIIGLYHRIKNVHYNYSHKFNINKAELILNSFSAHKKSKYEVDTYIMHKVLEYKEFKEIYQDLCTLLHTVKNKSEFEQTIYMSIIHKFNMLAHDISKTTRYYIFTNYENSFNLFMISFDKLINEIKKDIEKLRECINQSNEAIKSINEIEYDVVRKSFTEKLLPDIEKIINNSEDTRTRARSIRLKQNVNGFLMNFEKEISKISNKDDYNSLLVQYENYFKSVKENLNTNLIK